ncbi:hypothetical protein PMAYCL1PPCAC_03760, partial [Pristionchus mayeri]
RDDHVAVGAALSCAEQPRHMRTVAIRMQLLEYGHLQLEVVPLVRLGRLDLECGDFGGVLNVLDLVDVAETARVQLLHDAPLLAESAAHAEFAHLRVVDI